MKGGFEGTGKGLVCSEWRQDTKEAGKEAREKTGARMQRPRSAQRMSLAWLFQLQGERCRGKPGAVCGTDFGQQAGVGGERLEPSA